MTDKAKSPERRRSPSGAIGAGRFPRASAAARTGSFGSMASDAVVFGAERGSFDRVLQRVLGFSRVADGDARRRGARDEQAASPVADGSDVGAPSPAFDALKLFVRSLDRETQDKMRALIRAGRDAQTLPAALASLTAERTSESTSTPELFARDTTELQDLQRGHAVACATGFDLELDLTVWGKVGEPQSLDERVWLRFGRELARSRIEEWACFAVVDARDRLEKLYLRRGKCPWWSFAALIDRPSERALRVPRGARTGRSRLVVLPVQTALGRSYHKNLGALRRASMAVSARFGKSQPAPRRAGKAGSRVAR